VAPVPGVAPVGSILLLSLPPLLRTHLMVPCPGNRGMHRVHSNRAPFRLERHRTMCSLPEHGPLPVPDVPGVLGDLVESPAGSSGLVGVAGHGRAVANEARNL